MIRLTRLNHAPLMVNSDLIEQIEGTPDTVISLTSGQKFMVLETPEEVRDRIVEFRRAINERQCCRSTDMEIPDKALNEDGDGNQNADQSSG